MMKEQNMKSMIRICVIVLAVLPITLLGQSDWKSFNGDSYSINYPGNWDLDDSKRMGSQFFLFSRLENEQDQFKENVNLLTQDLSAYNMDIDQYVKLSIGQVESMIKEGKIISSAKVIDEGLEYHSLIYTGKQAENTLRFEQRFWIIDKVAYILTFTAQLDTYRHYKEVGDKVIRSFEIL